MMAFISAWANRIKSLAPKGFTPTPPAVSDPGSSNFMSVDTSVNMSVPAVKSEKPAKKAGKNKGVPKKATTTEVQQEVTQPKAPTIDQSGLVVKKADYSQDQEEEQAARMANAVMHPAAPVAFQGLQTSNKISIELEPNQTSQVDLSDASLRNLSPFMIQVEPPLVYGENGGFQNKKINSVTTDFAVGLGMGTDLTGYDQARKALAQSGLAGFNSGMSRINTRQETVSENGQGPAKNSTPTGAKSDNNGNIGQPAIADVYTAIDIASQLSAMVNTPPLVLLINPTTMAMAYNKIQQYQERTRYGFVLQAWGEDQPKMSITARCGAFVSGERGVQFASRRDSVAWQNLMNAFQMFRNAGYIHDTVGKSNAHHMIGSLSIRYDGWIYYGNMETFTFTVDEEHMNGGIEFSMDFVVSAMVDTGQSTFVVSPMKSPTVSPSDPRYQGMVNQSQNTAGEFSVGTDANGNPVLLTQGREVGVGDAFMSMIPAAGVTPFGAVWKSAKGYRTPDSTTIGKVMPPSDKGFFLDPIAVGPGERSVSIATPNSVDPFRVGSTT
jgi:hypothetical protein